MSSLFKQDRIAAEQQKRSRVKYRTIRVREEVAKELDEWRDLFEDSSLSEVIYRVFALARKELKRVKEKKMEVRKKFLESREGSSQA